MNHRQWKKNYKKQYGYNPPAYMDKRKRRKARAQQSLPCAGISVEQITQAMATFTEAVFTAAGNMCNALAQAFSRQPQFKAHPLDKDGTLLIFDEDIVTEV